MSLALPLPLPRVQGPKLAPFNGTAHADIEFIRPIGDSEDRDSYVWEVEIDARKYALKTFVFYSWKGLASDMASSLSGSLTPQGYRDYYEPFNCECRVYGRLRQEAKEDIATRAHGYILLSPCQERLITEKLTGCRPLKEDKAAGGRPLNGDEGPWFRWEEHRGHPVRAIVKDLMVDEGGNLCSPFTVSQVPQMYEDLETLHSLGILVRDIHMGNYMNGKLVDFSRAFTMYHPSLDRPVEYLMERFRFQEGMNLLEMAEDESDAFDALFVEVPRGLSRYLEGDLGIDPRGYNWHKREDEHGFKPDDLFVPIEHELSQGLAVCC